MEEVRSSQLDRTFAREINEAIPSPAARDKMWNCLSCGMCTGGCVYSDVIGLDPRKFMRKALLGLKEDLINDPMLWYCTMCARCTVDCPMDVPLYTLVRTVRGHFANEKCPSFLQGICDTMERTGNQMGVTGEDYVDTVKWMEGELRDELGDPTVEFPIDRHGTDFAYVIDPREVKYYPQELRITGKLFHAAGADYTYALKAWDATNWALFNGRDDQAGLHERRLAEEILRLGTPTMVVTECGHAMFCQMEMAKWYVSDPLPYVVKSVLSLYEEWIRAGRLRFRKGITEPVTLHDPCNVTRKLSITGPQRFLLNLVCQDFREMEPHGKYNICCGGGGGTLGMPEYTNERLVRGRLKADQIRATGSTIVAVPCHNCFDQLNDINKYYQLGVKVVHISHLLEQCLVWPERAN
ncbi:MAG: (Fe-S)-binding protein [Peptococcaceae bacterium]|nr:(Fe-S)-binding protein [Peptococcaceae bacterium]